MTAIGVGATLLLTLVVVVALSRTGGSKAVSDNAALIGALVGLGGVFTTQLVNSVIEDRRAQAARVTEQEQRTREFEVAEQRSQDDASQAYLDQMTDLLLDKDKPLRQSENHSEVRILARARTLTVLPRLDGYRKGSIVQFLCESNLVTKGRVVVNLEGADLRGSYLRDADLRDADLGGANLRGADLKQADLKQANLVRTNLSEANMYGADLSGADLIQANLHKADLRGLKGAGLNEADLRGANLSEANLRGANLQRAQMDDTLGGGNQVLKKGPVTDLEGATLVEAHLENANLSEGRLEGARLEGAHLEGANLSGAKGITTETLEQQAASLEGASMPDGSKHP